MIVLSKILWYFQNRTVVGLLVCGGVLSGAGFAGMRQWDNRKFHADFDAGAERRVRAISRQVDGDLSALVALRAFMEVRHPLVAADFDGFSARLVQSHPSLLAVEWIARVRGAAARQAFETE